MVFFNTKILPQIRKLIICIFFEIVIVIVFEYLCVLCASVVIFHRKDAKV